MHRPLMTVQVAGGSMLPALRPGDCLVVRRGAPVAPGDVVVATFPARPDLLVVKRAVRPVDDRWWVEGDRPGASDDSREHGPADVVGRVLLRYWPSPGRVGRPHG